MPHQIIEYSANLDTEMDIAALVAALHETAMGIDALPIGGIRTRAVRRDHYLVADRHPDNSFINVTLRIAEGRTEEEKTNAGDALFGTLTDFVSDIYSRVPMSLSYEIQEINPNMRWKQGNIRDYMAKRSA